MEHKSKYTVGQKKTTKDTSKIEELKKKIQRQHVEKFVDEMINNLTKAFTERIIKSKEEQARQYLNQVKDLLRPNGSETLSDVEAIKIIFKEIYGYQDVVVIETEPFHYEVSACAPTKIEKINTTITIKNGK